MKKNEIDHGITIEDKNKIIGVLSVLFSDAKIYLYGSRAKGTHNAFSDIDVAIDAKEAIPLYAINEAKSMLAETNILYKIDVVDIHNIPQVLKDRILKEGVIWEN